MLLELFIFCASAIGVHFLYREWSKRNRSGIKYLPFKFPFGHLDKVIKREKSLGLAINEFYHLTEDRLVGLYLGFESAILVRDPEIVKMMMTSHFEHFSDRGMHPDKEKSPLSANLFSLELDEWRPLRAKLTPAFSAAKLNLMMGQIQDMAKNLQAQLMKAVTAKGSCCDVKIKDFSTRFVVDVIASTIFGLEVAEEDNFLRQMGKKFSAKRNTDLIESVRIACMMLWPRISRFLGLRDQPEFVSDFFLNLVRQTFESRAKSGLVRHDVMQQLLQLRNTGSVDNNSWSSKATAQIPFMSIEECASNAFLFYIAGSETSMSTICYCLFELSREPGHLSAVHEEIDTVLRSHDGAVTYDALKEMQFLQKCIIETLRKYPALPMLNRRCTKDFTLPGTNQIIYRGQPIIIPLRAIQNDPRLFPNPLKFNPNRSDSHDPDYSSTPFQAFGEGPKSCIAYRLGTIMVKSGLVAILSKLTVQRPTEEDELQFPIGNLGMPPSEDFTVRLALR